MADFDIFKILVLHIRNKTQIKCISSHRFLPMALKLHCCFQHTFGALACAFCGDSPNFIFGRHLDFFHILLDFNYFQTLSPTRVLVGSILNLAIIILMEFPKRKLGHCPWTILFTVTITFFFFAELPWAYL